MKGEHSQTTGNNPAHSTAHNAAHTQTKTIDSVHLLLEQNARIEHSLNQILPINPTMMVVQKDKLQR